MNDGRRPYVAPSYIWVYVVRRRRYAAVIVFLAVVAAILLAPSKFLAQLWNNLSIKLVVDFTGAIVVLLLIAAFIERAELCRDSVLESLDHRVFVRQVADAQRRVMIFEMWTDLLQGACQRLFSNAMRAALDQGVESTDAAAEF